MVPGSHFQGLGCHCPMFQCHKSQVPGSQFQGVRVQSPMVQTAKVQLSRVSGRGSQVLGSWVSDPDFRLCPLKACVGFSSFDSFSFLLRSIHPKENDNFRENFKISFLKYIFWYIFTIQNLSRNLNISFIVIKNRLSICYIHFSETLYLKKVFKIHENFLVTSS